MGISLVLHEIVFASGPETTARYVTDKSCIAQKMACFDVSCQIGSKGKASLARSTLVWFGMCIEMLTVVPG
jgi:hypothetical protein